jgi:hypothetical protein
VSYNFSYNGLAFKISAVQFANSLLISPSFVGRLTYFFGFLVDGLDVGGQYVLQDFVGPDVLVNILEPESGLSKHKTENQMFHSPHSTLDTYDYVLLNPCLGSHKSSFFIIFG